MHSKSMHPAIFLKVNLGLAGALKNVERTYLLDSNNKSRKTQQSCRIGVSRDSIKHDYLVISGVLYLAASNI